MTIFYKKFPPVSFISIIHPSCHRHRAICKSSKQARQANVRFTPLLSPTVVRLRVCRGEGRYTTQSPCISISCSAGIVPILTIALNTVSNNFQFLGFYPSFCIIGYWLLLRSYFSTSAAASLSMRFAHPFWFDFNPTNAKSSSDDARPKVPIDGTLNQGYLNFPHNHFSQNS